ncbi:flagellin [Pseudorhodobacter sp. W20_MBD10_FR17]|uniref:flagellin n=1 Tax=Pseudorhodobacter sp. W20_MBD10_FR17 TaxID=3240266 RepID=UPI003F998D6E
MDMNGIGDMAQTASMRRFSTGLKQSANTAAQELTTGYTADVGRKLGGELSNLTGLETSLTRLSGYKVATDAGARLTGGIQTVLEQMDWLTDGMGISLMNAATISQPGFLEGMVADGANKFESLLSSLNTRVGERTLFAGVASGGPAVASADVILSAIEAAIVGAGAVSSVDIKAAVSAWFDDPSGYRVVGYLGGEAAAALSVSAEDKLDIGFTAADPAIRDTLKSMAMVALVDRGTVIADSETGAELIFVAGNQMLQNQADRAVLAGRVGLAQARVDLARTRNEAEGSALQLARSDLLAVDPYEAATRMEAAQTQLETLYSVTVRLSRLSLVDFL